MSPRTATPDARGRRLVAPIALILAVSVVVATAWWLAEGLRVASATVPVEVRESGTGAMPERGPAVLAVIETDTLSLDVIELIDAITTQSESVPGIIRVESVTNVGVITTLPPGVLASTPAFGSDSLLSSTTDVEKRAQLAAAGQLGTAGLLAPDGRTYLVAAEVDPTRSSREQDEAARAFRDRATLAVSVSGLPVTIAVGGAALTTAEATDEVRTDLTLLVGLACLAPAAIALVVLRRRVPAGALLAAGGAALLLAAILVNGEAVRSGAAPLDPDHPVTAANTRVDQELRGTIPVTIDVLGAPGAFRRPDVLARMDAFTTWLRDEYGVTAIDLPTTLRAEAGAITGVDSIPSNPDDIADLLTRTEQFESGRYLDRIANEDFSRTRIVAWLPEESRARLDELASRQDRISVVVFDDLGISARFGAEVVSVAPTRQLLADDLALLGMLAVALGALVALVTVWDRHRHEERQRVHHRRLFGSSGRHHGSSTVGRTVTDPNEHRWNRSLFARHGHHHERAHRPGDSRDEHAERDSADRFERQRPVEPDRRTGSGPTADDATVEQRTDSPDAQDVRR